MSLELLVSLVGEQPIPNLLVTRQLQPARHLLVYTHRTEPVARRLRSLISQHSDLSQDLLCKPYDFEALVAALRSRLDLSKGAVFNLTGGTKLMSLGAYALAAETGSQVVYYENEGRRLLTYILENGSLKRASAQKLPTLINIDDYLRAHWPGYRQEGPARDEQNHLNQGGLFEQAVFSALKPRCDEVLCGVHPEGVADQIEIDLVVRRGNQIGVLELKLGGNRDSGKKGMGQLKLAAEATYLGTYACPILVVGAGDLNKKIKTLAEKRRIHIIYLPEYQEGRALPRPVAERLVLQINQVLDPPPSRFSNHSKQTS